MRLTVKLLKKKKVSFQAILFRPAEFAQAGGTNLLPGFEQDFDVEV